MRAYLCLTFHLLHQTSVRCEDPVTADCQSSMPRRLCAPHSAASPFPILYIPFGFIWRPPSFCEGYGQPFCEDLLCSETHPQKSLYLLLPLSGHNFLSPNQPQVLRASNPGNGKINIIEFLFSEITLLLTVGVMSPSM